MLKTLCCVSLFILFQNSFSQNFFEGELKFPEKLLTDPIGLKNFLLINSNKLKLDENICRKVKTVREAIEKAIAFSTSAKFVPSYDISIEEGMVTLWIEDIHSPNKKDRANIGIVFFSETIDYVNRISGNNISCHRYN